MSDKQKDELDKNREKLIEVREEIKKNADAHDEATKRIMFNLLEQRAALDGFTKAELGFLTEIAEKWGLVDKATADYVTNADLYLSTLEATSGENLGKVRLDLSKTLGIMDEATGKMFTMRDAIAEIEGVHDIEIRVKVTGGKIPSMPGKGGGAIPLQHGTSFTVPGGFPNDSFFFPMALSSGEHVDVTPKGRSRGRGGNTYIYNRYGDRVNIENSAQAAFLVEKQRQAEFDEISRVI